MTTWNKGRKGRKLDELRGQKRIHKAERKRITIKTTIIIIIIIVAMKS